VGLAEGLSTLGMIQRHEGDCFAAQKSFAAARTALESAAGTSPADANLQGRLGAVLTLQGVTLADLGQTVDAQRSLQHAREILTPLGSSPGADAQLRGWLTEALWELGRILRASRKPAEADRLDADRSDLWKDRPSGELAGLALHQASRAALIGYGKTAINDRAQSVRERDLDQAATNLRMAISLGYKELASPRAHPDSWLLLSRDDIKPLLLDLDFPRWPFDESR
jgi:hypothetical protein